MAQDLVIHSTPLHLRKSLFELNKEKSCCFLKRISFPTNLNQTSKQFDKSSINAQTKDNQTSNSIQNSLNEVNKRKLIQINKILVKCNESRQRNENNKFSKFSFTSNKIPKFSKNCRLNKMFINVEGKKIDLSSQNSLTKSLINHFSSKSKNQFRFQKGNMTKNSKCKHKGANIHVYNTQKVSNLFKNSQKIFQYKKFINIQLPSINTLYAEEKSALNAPQEVQQKNKAFYDILSYNDKYIPIKSTYLNKSINFSFISKCTDENQNKYLSKFKQLIMRLK